MAAGLSKAISIFVGLISVRLTLEYLGTDRYGLWMAISAVIAIFGFSDLGLNNGLLNGIAKAYGRGDRRMAQQYVSSAFFILVAVAVTLGAVFAIAYPWVPWDSLFRVRSAKAASEIGPAVSVFAACFLFNIPAGIVSRIQSGYQEGFVSNLWAALGSFLSLLALLVVIHSHGSLPLLVLAMAGAPTLALVLNSVVHFGVQRPWLIPSLRYVKFGTSKDLLHRGSLFFVLQLAGAIGFSSDNVVLARVIGPEAVAQYAVPWKLFSLVAMLSSFFVAPLWPAYGEALERQDHRWIRRTLFRSLMIAAGLSAILSAALVTFGNSILYFWVGARIHASPALLAGLGVWSVISAVSMAIAIFLNGLGLMRFQVIVACVGAPLNLGLSLYLTRRIGIPGVVYGSILSQLAVCLIPYYWYVRCYLNNRLCDAHSSDTKTWKPTTPGISL